MAFLMFGLSSSYEEKMQGILVSNYREMRGEIKRTEPAATQDLEWKLYRKPDAKVIANKEGRFSAALFIPCPAITSYAAFIAFLRSAQRFFIISDMRLLAAALK